MIRDVKTDLESLEQLNKPREEVQAKTAAFKAKQVQTGLNRYEPSEAMPWDKRRVAHLLRRTGFGANHQTIATYEQVGAQQTIDIFMNQIQNLPLPPAPDWINDYPPPPGSSQAERQAFNQQNNANYIQYFRDWMYEMRINPLREKMVLFWHNHFVTQVTKYRYAAYTYRYIYLLRNLAFGNFKTLVNSIGRDHAMLIYLDGVTNRAGGVNENYARELLELFTIGLGNYTQDDVREIARALTGWRVNNSNFEVSFVPGRHDTDEKTFFGRTGNFGYSDVIEILFEEKADEIADFICRKIYTEFVYEGVDENVLAGLKQTFLDNDFEILPVVEQLIRSEHFYDDEFIGSKIKSPAEFLIGMYIETNTPPASEALDLEVNFMYLMDQFLFNPPNVAGWPEYHSWISTSTLPVRWMISQYNLSYRVPAYSVDGLKVARAMSNPNNPYDLCNDLAEYMLAVSLPQEDLDKLPEILLAGQPSYEWTIDQEGAEVRVLRLMNYLRQLPEYNLM